MGGHIALFRHLLIHRPGAGEFTDIISLSYTFILPPCREARKSPLKPLLICWKVKRPPDQILPYAQSSAMQPWRDILVYTLLFLSAEDFTLKRVVLATEVF
jgi:hypothetical protein